MDNKEIGHEDLVFDDKSAEEVIERFKAEKVDAVMLTVEAAKKHLKCKNEPIITGLPVRGELLEADGVVSRAELGFNNNPIILLSQYKSFFESRCLP